MSGGPAGHGARGVAAGVLLLFAVVVFAPALLFGDYFARDVLAYWHAQASAFTRVVTEGAWPLWDPYEGFGMPMLADPGSQVCYPPTWINLVLPPAPVYTILVFAHALAAGLGTYLLASRWGLSRPASVLAGLAWMGSGPFLSMVGLYHHYMGAAWTPWVLWALERALASGSRRDRVWLGLIAAGQLFAGSGDLCLAAALLAVGRVVQEVASAGDRARAARNVLAVAGTAALLAALVGAIQWLPTVAWATRTARAALPSNVSLYWSTSPLALVETVLPHLLADLPLSDPVRAALLESREPFLASLYLGIPVSALALMGLGLRGRRLFLTLTLALLVLLALGRFTPIGSLLLALPPFRLFRYPVKYLVPAALCWALLAGHGFDRLTAAAVGRRLRIVLYTGLLVLAAAGLASAVALVRHPEIAASWLNAPPDWREAALAPVVRKLTLLAALALATAGLLRFRGRLGLQRAGLLWIGLAGLDLAIGAAGLNPVAPRGLVAHRPPLLSRIGPKPEGQRVYSVPEDTGLLNRDLVRGPVGWDMQASWMLGLQDLLLPPSGARWGLKGSFDPDFTGLAPVRQAEAAAFLVRVRETPRARHLLRAAGVEWVVSRDQAPLDLEPVAIFESVFRTPVRVWRVPDPMPGAFLVGAALPEPAEGPIRLLADPQFDFATTVLLEPTAPPHPSPPDFRGVATVRASRADRLVVDVQASHAGWLVRADAFDPGWSARLDGAAVPLVRANVLFQAVAVPAGAHRVEMVYRPAAVRVGLWLTLAGLALCAFAAWPRRVLPATHAEG